MTSAGSAVAQQRCSGQAVGADLWSGRLRLTLGGGYLAPASSGGCPADIAAWWMELQAEWAEAEAAGAVLLAGNVNGRTSCGQTG